MGLLVLVLLLVPLALCVMMISWIDWSRYWLAAFKNEVSFWAAAAAAVIIDPFRDSMGLSGIFKSTPALSISSSCVSRLLFRMVDELTAVSTCVFRREMCVFCVLFLLDSEARWPTCVDKLFVWR